MRVGTRITFPPLIFPLKDADRLFKMENIEASTEAKVRVSYLITTRNRAKFLQRTLDNVREFITPQDELIVIDGGSTDETVAILERNRDIVSFYLSEPDKSEAHALNKGLFRAKGKYIKPITDDDYVYPDAIFELINQMELCPDVDLLVGGGEVWYPSSTGFNMDHYRRLPPDIEATPFNIFKWAHHGLGMIIRKNAVELIGGAAGNYTSVDGDIFVKLIECKCSIGYLDVNLYKWYIHPHSGIHKEDAFHHDSVQIAARLNQWDEVLSPSGIGGLLKHNGIPVTTSVKAAIYGAWLSTLLARFGLSIIPIFSGVATYWIFQILKKIAPSKSSRKQNMPDFEPNWTGLLRGSVSK